MSKDTNPASFHCFGKIWKYQMEQMEPDVALLNNLPGFHSHNVTLNQRPFFFICDTCTITGHVQPTKRWRRFIKGLHCSTRVQDKEIINRYETWRKTKKSNLVEPRHHCMLEETSSKLLLLLTSRVWSTGSVRFYVYELKKQNPPQRKMGLMDSKTFPFLLILQHDHLLGF